MAKEIERKFLVTNTNWKANATPALFKQAYLNSDPHRTVRVRIENNQAFLTIKSKSIGIERQEFEYAIPLNDAEHLLHLCETPALEKIRHTLVIDQHTWEIDEFLGVNAGLIVAEIELQTASEHFTRPEWLGKEVSEDPRYFNSYLSNQPFTTWKD